MLIGLGKNSASRELSVPCSNNNMPFTCSSNYDINITSGLAPQYVREQFGLAS